MTKWTVRWTGTEFKCILGFYKILKVRIEL